MMLNNCLDASAIKQDKKEAVIFLDDQSNDKFI